MAVPQGAQVPNPGRMPQPCYTTIEPHQQRVLLHMAAFQHQQQERAHARARENTHIHTHKKRKQKVSTSNRLKKTASHGSCKLPYRCCSSSINLHSSPSKFDTPKLLEGLSQ
eukprot:scaffold67817_cov20-Tisochrysis_lutea.AAC.1